MPKDTWMPSLDFSDIIQNISVRFGTQFSTIDCQILASYFLGDSYQKIANSYTLGDVEKVTTVIFRARIICDLKKVILLKAIHKKQLYNALILQPIYCSLVA